MVTRVLWQGVTIFSNGTHKHVENHISTPKEEALGGGKLVWSSCEPRTHWFLKRYSSLERRKNTRKKKKKRSSLLQHFLITDLRTRLLDANRMGSPDPDAFH